MGRKRTSRQTSSLPKNLYCDSRYGLYRYKHPLTGKFHGMGRNKSDAIEAANILNHELVGANSLVSQIKGANDKTISDACDLYEKEKINNRSNLSNESKRAYRTNLKAIRNEFKDTLLSMLTTEMAANFLNISFNDKNDNISRYKLARKVFIWIIDHAIRQGWIHTNPVTITESKSKKRSRQRWTIETYQATYNAASSDLKNAMDLCLYTVFGINELITLKFSDIEGMTIEKTRKKTGTNQRIYMNQQLMKVITRCRNTGIVSPFVLHHRPPKILAKNNKAKGREHWTQWTHEQLQSELRETRKKTGLFESIPPKDQPGFHSIRALGAWLLYKQNIPIESISALLGHKSVATTKIYLDGHEPEWIEGYVKLCS